MHGAQVLEAPAYHLPSLSLAAGRFRANASVVLVWLCLAGFLLVAVRCAWITEDAYIMFRTIDNFLHGLGLTWNPTERVQVYTCPLWTFLLIPVIGATGQFYLSTVAVCLAVTLATGAVLLRGIALSRAAGILGLGVLAFSKGFMDYSTSGLENPLAHLLLAGFALAYFRTGERPTAREFFRLALLADLIVLNRMDHGVLVGPALLWAWWNSIDRRAAFWAGLLGMVPFLAWEAFSLVYYGFLFPNTAYAKLNLGLATTDLARQGLHYYANAWHSDPQTLLAIAAGLGAALATRQTRSIALALGVLVYLGYILRIGGDYMSMRFFTAPLLLAVVLLVRHPRLSRPIPALTLALALLALSLSTPRPSLGSGAGFGTHKEAVEVDSRGIADERGYYYPILGLLKAQPWNSSLPSLLERRRTARREEFRQVKVTGNIGMDVFEAAERIHAIDLCALAEPLLARLPAKAEKLRVGHYLRHLPEGYPETIDTGENRLADPNLARYYDELRLVTSAPVWSWDRFRAIWRINTGQLAPLIDHEHYRHSGAAPQKTSRPSGIQSAIGSARRAGSNRGAPGY
jgi:arabinofuranosyltransferase